MMTRKSGGRHPLLFYRRSMGRLWITTFFLGLVLAMTWGWRLIEAETQVIVIISTETLFLVGAIVAFAVSFFAFIARWMAYVRVFDKYLRIVTPFLRMNISYQRVLGARPMLIQQIFPKEESKWAQRRFLEPFYGKTALVLELKSYPENPTLLKLFLPPQMFSPQFTGFVLLVPDWMKFSMEFDSFRGAMQQARKSQERASSIRTW